MNNLPRYAPQAAIKVLSFASENGKLSRDAFASRLSYDGFTVGNGSESLRSVLKGRRFNLFRTVGLAESISIERVYNTTLVHGVGNPTQPRIVPGNYSVNMSLQKVTLDSKNNDSFITSPEYWYSSDVQRAIGAYGYGLYTYLAIRERGNSNTGGISIYAMMPVNDREEISAQSPTIMANVQMTGFKITYASLVEGLFDELEPGELI